LDWSIVKTFDKNITAWTTFRWDGEEKIKIG
jgi:hypothetical protein